MAIPPRLEAEIGELGKSFDLEVVEDADVINLIFKSFPVGDGFSVANTDLLLRMPRSYPDAGPDMFWTNVDVTFPDGAVPKNADQIESYLGRQWRRFSWHRSAWNPTYDRVSLHLDFINARLRKKE